MVRIKDIIKNIDAGNYPYADLIADCREHGEIETIIYELTIEYVLRTTDYNTYKDRHIPIGIALDYIKHHFPVEAARYQRLKTDGPYEYKKKRNKDGVKDLREIPRPTGVCSAHTFLTEDQLASIYNRLIENGFINSSGEKSLEEFLLIFRKDAELQGHINWARKADNKKFSMQPLVCLFDTVDELRNKLPAKDISRLIKATTGIDMGKSADKTVSMARIDSKRSQDAQKLIELIHEVKEQGKEKA